MFFLCPDCAFVWPPASRTCARQDLDSSFDSEQAKVTGMAFIVHGASPFGVLSDVSAGPEIHQPNAENHLLCVGCGNFRAASQEQLREHYKSEWHRYLSTLCGPWLQATGRFSVFAFIASDCFVWFWCKCRANLPTAGAICGQCPSDGEPDACFLFDCITVLVFGWCSCSQQEFCVADTISSAS